MKIKKLFGYLFDPFSKGFILFLLTVNFFGSIYGFYWYRYQLAETSWHYLPFVPDSPLSSTLFTVALAFILLRRRSALLELLAYIWVIKYGIWAVIINVDAGITYGTFGWDNLMLALSHGGMAIEGWIFLRHLRFKPLWFGVISLWLLINDYVDYVLGQHPWLFDDRQLGLASYSAYSLSIGLILIMLYHLLHGKRHK